MAKKRVFIDSGSLAGRMSLSPVYAAATGAFILTGLSFLEVFGVLDVFGERDIVADVLPLPLPIICLAAANSVQYRPILPVERSSSLADASAITCPSASLTTPLIMLPSNDKDNSHNSG